MAETTSKFQVGQVWSYKARPQESDSRLTIVQVDMVEKYGRIVHINLQGLKMRNPQVESGYSTTFSHMPFAEEALERSVIALLEVTDTLPEYREGYDMWRQAFEAGKAGVFTASPAECIDVAEQAVSGASHPSSDGTEGIDESHRPSPAKRRWQFWRKNGG